MITVHTRTARGFVFPLTRCECRDLADRLLESLEMEAGDLELCLVDDVEMSGLHEQHLGGIGPTNVLAFPEEFEEQGISEMSGVFEEAFAPDAYADADNDVYGDDEDYAHDAEDYDASDADDATDDTAWADAQEGPEVFLPELLHAESFSGDEHEEGFVSGSIVFSVDALYRECVLYTQPPEAYFARLLAHALLHLTGVPHGDYMEERMDFAVAQALAALAE